MRYLSLQNITTSYLLLESLQFPKFSLYKSRLLVLTVFFASFNAFVVSENPERVSDFCEQLFPPKILRYPFRLMP